MAPTARITWNLSATMRARGNASQFAAARKIPSPGFLVPFSGLWIVVGSLSVLLGIYGDVGALMIALFVIATALFMHPYWKEDDEQSKMMEQIQFSKDLGLAGGALGLFVMFAALGGELGLTATEALFELSAPHSRSAVVWPTSIR